MDVFEAISTRRAIKNYDSTHEMPEADLKKLLTSALLAPTSFNIQNWRFINVNNKNKRLQIKEAAWGQEQITDASVLLVLCADLKSWAKSPERYWENAPTQVKELIVPMITPFYEGREWMQRDEAMRSIGFAAQTIMLAARGLGYDTCPMIGFDIDKVSKIINLPSDHVIGMILVIGKATKNAWPRPGQIPLEEVLFTDSF